MVTFSDPAAFLQSRKFGITAFLIPLLIRAIPEILVGPYPVGWDIITHYIPSSLYIASAQFSDLTIPIRGKPSFKPRSIASTK